MRAPGGGPLLALVLLAALLLAGCGIRPEDGPEPVVTAAPPSTDPGSDRPSDGPRLTVFFVRGAVLAPVERPARAATSAEALGQLVEGPTRREADAGIRTALAPEVVGVDRELPDGLTTVSVTRGFTGLTGGNQLLAVAQVVWTLTEFPTVSSVRFVVDGTAVEVPTDTGLTDRPVDRDDYPSGAPPEPAPTTTTPGIGVSPSASPTPG